MYIYVYIYTYTFFYIQRCPIVKLDVEVCNRASGWASVHWYAWWLSKGVGEAEYLLFFPHANLITVCSSDWRLCHVHVYRKLYCLSSWIWSTYMQQNQLRPSIVSCDQVAGSIGPNLHLQQTNPYLDSGLAATGHLSISWQTHDRYFLFTPDNSLKCKLDKTFFVTRAVRWGEHVHHEQNTEKICKSGTHLLQPDMFGRNIK